MFGRPTRFYVVELTCVNRWGWIAYPITTLLLVTAFVIGTVVQSQGEKPWKDSILPALFHGIRDLREETYKRLHDPAEMRDQAERLLARLGDWDQGLLWRTTQVSSAKSREACG